MFIARSVPSRAISSISRTARVRPSITGLGGHKLPLWQHQIKHAGQRSFFWKANGDVSGSGSPNVNGGGHNGGASPNTNGAGHSGQGNSYNSFPDHPILVHPQLDAFYQPVLFYHPDDRDECHDLRDAFPLSPEAICQLASRIENSLVSKCKVGYLHLSGADKTAVVALRDLVKVLRTFATKLETERLDMSDLAEFWTAIGQADAAYRQADTAWGKPNFAQQVVGWDSVNLRGLYTVTVDMSRLMWANVVLHHLYRNIGFEALHEMGCGEVDAGTPPPDSVRDESPCGGPWPPTSGSQARSLADDNPDLVLLLATHIVQGVELQRHFARQWFAEWEEVVLLKYARYLIARVHRVQPDMVQFGFVSLDPFKYA